MSYVPHMSASKILTCVACLGLALLFGGVIFLVQLSFNPPVTTSTHADTFQHLDAPRLG
jgi:hypothetical protein